MNRNVRLIAVLDTNVIYPVISRDLLFWFAYYELYTPRWSTNVFNEWKAVMIRKGVAEDEAVKRINKATLAFPNALVRNYSNLIKQLTLPDQKDRHVLAAAIKTGTAVIVTNNLKDFPKAYLQSFGVEAKTTDAFLTELITLNQEQAVAAFRELVLNKRNPPLNEYEVLNQMRKINLTCTADYLETII